ncbi:MAG: carotenoid biosynthesis protein [Chloroflexi bacterium]|nr:carotenoid biosynthesis protein [Chloroflexota bacterium]
MIALPIARWIWGDSVIPAMSTASTVFQCLAVLVVLLKTWHLPRLVPAVALTAILTWSAEFLGHTTGFPFGDYSYSGLLQPQLLDVPLLIPLAWLMMLGPSWAVSYAVLGDKVRTRRDWVLFAALTGLAMTAWDLYLDPQMVGWGFWTWEQSGPYFGIPLSNFAGWFAVAGLVTLCIRPPRLSIGPLLLVYAVVWAFQAIGLAVFWEQPGPALFGFVGMGAVMGIAGYRARRAQWTL